MQLDLLAIGAHPDDVELSCGGTVAKSAKLRYKVGILDLTEGELGTRGRRSIRAAEAAEAAQILGVHTRENLRLPDGNFEVNPTNRLKLIRIIRKYRPKILLMPHWDERHPDHVRAHHLCREAWFFSGLRKIQTKHNGKPQEPWRPHAFFHFMQKYEFAPTFIVDISDVYDKRMAAIRAYKSQFYNPTSKDPDTVLSQKSFLDFLQTRAKHFGHQIGAAYGEAFYSVKPIGVGDLLSLKFFRG